MTKGADGVWSITVGPVEPNLYPYHFVIDDVGVADSANPDHFPNERFKASLADIPGGQPALHSIQNVPHGEVSYAFYESKTLNRTRPLVIYTPPGYRAGTDTYPVLYLVSGTTDTEETWFRAGRMNFILDNLIAQKKAVPMIVVLPYGNMMMGAPAPNSPQAADMYRVFNDELIGNVIPHVETNYRVRADRESRAIAGFSRGGGQSLFTAFHNLDSFAWDYPRLPGATSTPPRSAAPVRGSTQLRFGRFVQGAVAPRLGPSPVVLSHACQSLHSPPRARPHNPMRFRRMLTQKQHYRPSLLPPPAFTHRVPNTSTPIPKRPLLSQRSQFVSLFSSS